MDTEIQAVDLAENIEEAYDLATLEAAYREYAFECSCALHLVEGKVNIVREQMKLSGRNPFAYTETRIKTFESAIKKCKNRGYGQSIEDVRKKCYDVAGIRVVVTFRDDIYRVRDKILRQPGIELIREKDYVANPKPNGYRALHLIVTNQITDSEGLTKAIPVEIQIRSRAEDLWASVEHIVGYKHVDPSPEAAEVFKEMAELMSKFDDRAIKFRDHASPETKAKPKPRKRKNPAK